jgi:hypothetical protein
VEPAAGGFTARCRAPRRHARATGCPRLLAREALDFLRRGVGDFADVEALLARDIDVLGVLASARDRVADGDRGGDNRRDPLARDEGER